MSYKIIGSIVILLLITACLPQLVVNSQKDATLSATSDVPQDNFFNFLPLLLSSRDLVETPIPDLTPSPGTVTPEPTTETPDPSPGTTTVTPSTSPGPSETPITPTTEPTEPTPVTDAIIADHNGVNDFPSIPESALTEAIALDTLFMHQSTGNNIKDLGFVCLAGLGETEYGFPAECEQYNVYDPYDNRNWAWTHWDANMSDATAKVDEWVSVANAQQGNYQILGMKLCYVDGWNLDFDYYRQAMEDLEQLYPTKTFIWATVPLVAESAINDLSSAPNIQSFNEQLRDYVISNNKILFDLAAIESHDPGGNPCIVDGLDAGCEEYYDGFGGDAGHPDVDGSIRLAKGFWYLMARIGGWDGN